MIDGPSHPRFDRNRMVLIVFADRPRPLILNVMNAASPSCEVTLTIRKSTVDRPDLAHCGNLIMEREASKLFPWRCNVCAQKEFMDTTGRYKTEGKPLLQIRQADIQTTLHLNYDPVFIWQAL